jgi:phytoene synthase
MDLGRVCFRTYPELERYCYRVASAVGLVSVEIFGCRHPEARRYAVELGHALQLTNIIRDVAEDLHGADRLYLPQEDLERFGVGEEDLRAPVTGDSVRALLAFEAKRARERFRAAERSFPVSDRRALRASELMRALYETLLGNMERGGFRVMEQRYRLSAWQKAKLLGSHWFR